MALIFFNQTSINLLQNATIHPPQRVTVLLPKSQISFKGSQWVIGDIWRQRRVNSANKHCCLCCKWDHHKYKLKNLYLYRLLNYFKKQLPLIHQSRNDVLHCTIIVVNSVKLKYVNEQDEEGSVNDWKRQSWVMSDGRKIKERADRRTNGEIEDRTDG